MTVLLDSSVAIALLATDHEDHDAAERWLASLDDTYATRPITQDAVVRYAFRHGRTPSGAVASLDAYLAQLARHRGGRVATFDRAFVNLHDDVTELVPT